MFHSSFWRRPALLLTCVLLVTLALPLTTFSKTAFAQGVSISLVPNSGPPNTLVTATGVGWPSNTTIQISFDQTYIKSTTSDANGQFSVGFNIPTNATQGLHPVYATDGRENASAPFTVTANTPTVTVQKVWAADGSNNAKSSFIPGDTIHYMVQINNSTGTTVTATVAFLANGPQQIYSWSGSASIAPGTPSFYSPSTVPSNALAGTYTITVTVTYNGASSQGQSAFTVATVTVQKVWTADGNNNKKTYFAPGDIIHYMAQVKNFNSATVTTTFHFLATGPQQIFSWAGSGSVVTGTPTFYSPSTVPSTASAGTYTLTVTVTYNGVSSQGQSTFMVRPFQSDYNTIWSGYYVKGSTTYTDIKGTWTVPTAQCSNVTLSRSATWVGIGGARTSGTLQQIGTSADCNNGQPHYWAWYEIVTSNPGSAVPINCGSGLKANDTVTAEVTYLGGGSFNLSIDTPECSFSKKIAVSGADISTAEWIVEDPQLNECHSQVACPLTHFVTNNQPVVNLSGCSANGNAISDNLLIWRAVITDNGQPGGTLKAFPLNLTSNDSAFSVQWQHS